VNNVVSGIPAALTRQRYNQEDKKEMLPKVGNSAMARSTVRN